MEPAGKFGARFDDERAKARCCLLDARLSIWRCPTDGVILSGTDEEDIVAKVDRIAPAFRRTTSCSFARC